MRHQRLLACVAMLAAVLVAGPARAEAPSEQATVATLPTGVGDHWLWVPDRLIQHSVLYDGDSGRVLGMVDSPSQLTPKTPLWVRARNEIYTADIAYSRGLRGERIDFVSIYDARTLDFVDEVVFPTRAGSSNTSQQYAELIGERFLGVFNQFPVTSVSIIDLVERRFVEEIPIAGCSGIYPTGKRRFATLCGNGTTTLVELDGKGHRARTTSSAAFFDAVEDPVAMSAGRAGSRWTFVSFEGQVHTVDFSGAEPVVEAPWSLLSDADRDEGWRPGGLQYVTVHGPSRRLFVVMHQGGPGSHKEAGPEVWAFDLERRERVGRFEPPNLTVAFLAGFMDIEPGSFVYRLMGWLVPSAGVHTIAVSQDAAPLLFVRNGNMGVVGVLDAISGEPLRILTEAGLSGPTLRVP